MKKVLLLIFIITTISSLFSVNYDRNVNQFTDDDEIFIQNCRTSISIKLDEGNSERIREIVRLISERFKGNLDVAFSRDELFVIGVECDSLELIFAPRIYRTRLQHCRGGRLSYYKSFDPLDHKATELMRKNIEFYSEKIMQSILTSEEKDFALLILESDLRTSVSVDDTNAKCDEFLANYPGSIYEKYIRLYLRYVYAPYIWGNGMSGYSSYSQGQYKFDEYFNDAPSFQGNMFFTYNNFVTNFLVKYDLLESSKAFSRTSFKKDQKFKQYTTGLQLGNRINSLQKLNVEPHIFVGSSYITYKKDGKTFLTSAFTTGIGFSVYYVIYHYNHSIINYPQNRNNIYSMGGIYAALSCDYYNPLYNVKYDYYNGGTLSISLGIGMYTRSNERVY